MPTQTENYGLTSFNMGDIYSAFHDKRRFRIIDNELAFASDLMRNGVIEGWTIRVEGSGTSAGTAAVGPECVVWHRNCPTSV